MAAVAVREKALTVAAHLLEASPADLEMRDGRIEVAGTDRRITLKAVAEAVSGVPGYSMPGNFEPGLESMQSFIPPALTYGIGCHAVEVEVDIGTCGVRILRYVVVNDSGRIVNPMIVEGQLARRRRARHRQFAAGVDGLRRAGAAADHEFRRLPAAGRDRGAAASR